jgi:hypothetical protein
MFQKYRRFPDYWPESGDMVWYEITSESVWCSLGKTFCHPIDDWHNCQTDTFTRHFDETWKQNTTIDRSDSYRWKTGRKLLIFNLWMIVISYRVSMYDVIVPTKPFLFWPQQEGESWWLSAPVSSWKRPTTETCAWLHPIELDTFEWMNKCRKFKADPRRKHRNKRSTWYSSLWEISDPSLIKVNKDTIRPSRNQFSVWKCASTNVVISSIFLERE